MTSRVLPVEEWPRLAETELAALLPTLDRDLVKILVIETQGAIVGVWPLVRTLHAHGVWIAPAYRRRGSVARRLVRALHVEATAEGVPVVFIAACTARIRNLTKRLGGEQLPGTCYAVPVKHHG